MSAGRILVVGVILFCLGLAFAGCARRGGEGPLLTTILKGA